MEYLYIVPSWRSSARHRNGVTCHINLDKITPYIDLNQYVRSAVLIQSILEGQGIGTPAPPHQHSTAHIRGLYPTRARAYFRVHDLPSGKTPIRS
jgi:hypothetical protein